MRFFGERDTYLKFLIPQGFKGLASSHKTIFDNSYMPNWTNEHFTVSQAVPPKRGTKRHVYKLVDYNDEAVKGSLYPEELQVILDNQYRIEKVLRRPTLPHNTKTNYLSGGKVGQKNTTRG